MPGALVVLVGSEGKKIVGETGGGSAAGRAPGRRGLSAAGRKFSGKAVGGKEKKKIALFWPAGAKKKVVFLAPWRLKVGYKIEAVQVQALVRHGG